jgi:hypothetical protein
LKTDEVMNMSANNSNVSPYPTFDGAINDAANEEGVVLDDLLAGAVIEAKTKGRVYRIEKCVDGKVLISGHPEYCAHPVLAELHGSVWGSTMIKEGYIGRGMGFEFRHPTLGLIRTTQVQQIRELKPAHASEKHESQAS